MMPWYHGWNVLAVGMLVAAVSIGTVTFSFAFYVVGWVEEFGTSRGTAFLALTASQLISGVVYPFAGRAMDRFPIGWVASAGIVSLAVGFVLIAFATSIWQVMIVYGVFVSVAVGLAGAMVGQTLAVRWFRARRGFAIGVAALGTSIGGFLMPPLVAYVVGEYGWRVAHLYMAVAMVIVLVPLLLAVVRGEPGFDEDADSGTGKEPSDADHEWSTGEIVANRAFWLLVAGFLPLMMMGAAIMANLPLWARDLGIDAQSAAYMVSVLSLTVIAGKLAFGYLADRREIRLLFFVSAGLVLCALILMIGRPGNVVLSLVIVLLGLSIGGYMPLSSALISRHFGAVAFGSVLGLFNLCSRPLAFSAAFGGWIRDTFGSYDYFWMTGIVLILLLTPAVYWIKPARH